jgi:hypothetical protein
MPREPPQGFGDQTPHAIFEISPSGPIPTAKRAGRKIVSPTRAALNMTRRQKQTL